MKRSWNIALVIIGAAMLAACSMTSSTLMDTARHMSCTHDGGTYYLPRTMVKVVIHDKSSNAAIKAATETGGMVMETVNAYVDQDRRYQFCLDFLKKATSDDTLIVSRNQKLLLGRISSSADDKSTDIIKDIIRTIFVGITGDPQFGNADRSALPGQLGDTKRLEFRFDPFDIDQTDLINNSLRRYGFCVFVKHSAFLARHPDINTYCDNPIGSGRRRIEKRILKISTDKDTDVPPSFTQGVFYRARLPYDFVVMIKPNRQARGGWKLRGSKSVLFENASPVFSVGVNRTYFAERKTSLVFDQGTLRDVQIDKDSELVKFVEIPLAIAKSIAAVPTSILQVRIDDTNNRHKLIKAQLDLLTSHKEYLESLEKYNAINAGDTAQPAASGIVAPSLDRSSPKTSEDAGLPAASGATAQQLSLNFNQCVAGCSKDGELASFCPAYCQCRVAQCTPLGDESACNALCGGLLSRSN